jgi:hypothetical protein
MTPIIDLDKYSQVIQDDAGAPGTVYIGVTNFRGATTDLDEWAVLRVTVAGSVTTYAWAQEKDFHDPAPQKWVWDDRATLTYG